MVGNTCAKIFTNGEFVQIIRMRYKSEAGKKLNMTNQEVRFANEICMENAPEKTCYNIEMQRVTRLESMEIRTTEPYYP